MGERAKAARDATGWHFCLDNLEATVDGNPAAGFDKERFSALNAEYAARSTSWSWKVATR